MLRFRRRHLLTGAAFASGARAAAQEARPNLPVRPKPPGGGIDPERRIVPNIRVDATLVQVPVSVLTPLGQSVVGLEMKDFRIFEDKVEQKAVAFGSFDAPLSVGLVFDASGSMKNSLGTSREAATQLFKHANPEDEFFLLQFSDRPKLIIPFTRDFEEIQSQLLLTPAKGSTALLDGIYQGLQILKKGRNARKALMILSDGGDNSSRYTETEVRRLVRESDAQMYALGIGADLSGSYLLTNVAEMTGGRYFHTGSISFLPDTILKIAIELRQQYLLGYAPQNLARDGKFRKLKVEVKPLRGLPKLKVYHRSGYHAPDS